MPICLKGDVVLVSYPFSDLSATKVRPAVIVHAPHVSQDSLIVPLTSRLATLLPGEFVLSGWAQAGLNVPSAVKRGIYTLHSRLILKCIGRVTPADLTQLEQALRNWLGL
jgi:mRNA interferase MazF